MNKQIKKIKERMEAGEWYRIAFLGDSITSTEWVHPNFREIIEYVVKMHIEEKTENWEPVWHKIRCYNVGFNGAVTPEILNYLNEELALYNPDMVIFLDTYNDIKKGITPEEHRANLEKIFDKLATGDRTVFFASSIASLSKEIDEENMAYLKEANKAAEKYRGRVETIDLMRQYQKLPLEKFFTFVSERGYSSPDKKPGGQDMTHPNPLGNAYIAKILLKDIFDIDFDPELYIKETLAGEKYPSY